MHECSAALQRHAAALGRLPCLAILLIGLC